MSPELDSSSSMHRVLRQKKKRLSTTDSKAPGVFQTYIFEAMRISIQFAH